VRDERERVVGEVNSVSACREVKMKGEEIRVRELRVPIASRRDHLEVVLDAEAEEVLRRKVERKEARVVSRSSEVLKYLKDIVCRMKTTNEARGVIPGGTWYMRSRPTLHTLTCSSVGGLVP
jgi:hypothetical protein